MSMPKKGTRQITVDGVRYRWKAISDGDRFCRYVLVQSADHKGSLLQASAAEGWRCSPALPSDVEQFIRKAIRAGWRPLDSGPPFRRVVELEPFAGQEFDPAWRTEAVLGIATTIRETLNYSIIPILADALEEAGCQNQALLTCCRAQWRTGEAGRVITLIFANL